MAGFYVAPSTFTLQNIVNSVGGAIGQQEQNLFAQLSELQSNPTTPSLQQLAIFQGNLQIWANAIQLESSIIKVYGDTMKQVVTNAGS